MVYFPDSYLDDLIREDAPYGDETSALLGIEDQPSMVVGAPKVTGVVSGVSVAAKLCRRVGLKATEHVKDGARVEAGTPVLTLEGTASQLHLVYKTAQRLMETCSGIAGRTRQMVDAAQSVNPNCQVALTRKHFPGAKLLSLYAILSGGGVFHRAGLSESILVFDQHRVFLPAPFKAVHDAKLKSPERRVTVEVATGEEGLAYFEAGADVIQCEKFSTEALKAFVDAVRVKYPAGKILAAGGINGSNAAVFAATGVDAIVTTWPYFAQPFDIKMRFKAL